MFTNAGWRTRGGADVEVLDFISKFAHWGKRDFGNQVAGEIACGVRGARARPKLERPCAFVGCGIKQREHRVQVDRVTIKAVAVVAGEPRKLGGGGLY
ncbi:MAG: hypothetical protein ACRD5L_14270 [Bryobacteraceae bacterium]